jgi:hypothetical protein
VITIFTHYAYDTTTPDGWLEAGFAIAAGDPLDQVVAVSQGAHVRVWYTPDGGSPVLLPSQVYAYEFGTRCCEPYSPSYETSFGSAIAAPTFE